MRRIYSFVLLLAAALSLTSCLDSDTSSGSITLYDDTAIIGFGLGTLNRNIFVYKTTPSTTGEDSTYLDTMYVEKVDCSGYHFTIDAADDAVEFGEEVAVLSFKGMKLSHEVACNVETGFGVFYFSNVAGVASR